jgi:outer membrane protein OmpA-like peptidoglycan-associated protein
MRLPAFLLTFLLCLPAAEAQVLKPAAGGYTTEQLVHHFVQSIDIGAARGICIGTPAECAAPSAELAPQGLDMMVTFELDSATITPEAAARLAVFAAMMQDERLEIARFAIEGHTDALGTEAYNQSLSEARAETVRQQLMAQGIAPERLSALGFGKSRPRSADQFDPGNRRVELRLDRE